MDKEWRMIRAIQFSIENIMKKIYDDRICFISKLFKNLKQGELFLVGTRNQYSMCYLINTITGIQVSHTMLYYKE